jgi:hypothetical protein
MLLHNSAVCVMCYLDSVCFVGAVSVYWHNFFFVKSVKYWYRTGNTLGREANLGENDERHGFSCKTYHQNLEVS